MTVFAKGANTQRQLSALSSIGYSTVGLDWTVTPRDARNFTQGRVALQGNCDPSVLHGGQDAIKREVRELVWGNNGFLTCAQEGLKGGWIVNLGHGITPGVDPESGMRYFLQRVRAECKKRSADEAESDESSEKVIRLVVRLKGGDIGADETAACAQNP